jgi:hypothetical protein
MTGRVPKTAASMKEKLESVVGQFEEGLTLRAKAQHIAGLNVWAEARTLQIDPTTLESV